MKITVQSKSCGHLTIATQAGETLDVLRLEDLSAEPTPNDGMLRLGLKYLVKQYLSAGNPLTAAGIKVFLEAREL